MQSLIKEILSHKVFVDRPPVLVDIGASGGIHKEWREIAAYSICIAFDADSRDFLISELSNCGYKKLFLINRIVTSSQYDSVNFYLTKSPHCSSSLRPNQNALEAWVFAPFFEIEEIKSMPTITLGVALQECGLDYIDWYKTDTQGTDLRIFHSLKDEIKIKIGVAEFEPGIVDAYEGEDKLYQLMTYMTNQPFWMSGLLVKGTKRLSKNNYDQLNSICKKFLNAVIKTAPCWGEVTYINNFKSNMGLREYLLGWIFASLKCQHGFALELAQNGKSLFSEEKIFQDLEKFTLKKIKKSYWLVLNYIVLNSIKRLLHL